MSLPDLPPLYYLTNFHLVHQWVWQHSADLLQAEQQALSQRFVTLTTDAQALLLRLLMRKGLWFRVSKLHYAEIACSPTALGELQQAGLLDQPTVMAAEPYAHLHTMAELRQRFPPLAHHARKAEFTQALCQAYPQGVSSVTSVVYLQPEARAWAERLLLLFFGNGHQDWTEFVLSDLGLYRYEQVAFSIGSRAFRHHADVQCYELLYRWRTQIAQATEQDRATLLPAAVQAVLALETDSDWLSERRAKTLYVLGQWAEKKATNLDLAEQAYAASRWPMASLRRARVLELQGRHQQAWEQGQHIMVDSQHEAVLQKWARIALRLHKKLALRDAPLPCSTGFEPSRVDLSLPPDPLGARIEQQVCDYYDHPQAPVFYVENTLIQALFALWCWDALYAPVAGAFFHPYQRGPADLYSPTFYQRRQGWFEQAWESLNDDSYKHLIETRWHSKHGLQCGWVQWQALSLDLLRMALQCISAADLRVIFQRLLDDLRENRSGLPDLIRFWPLEKRYEWIEVKGPGDRLQDNQLRWLRFFADHGMQASVCHVRWC